MSEIWLTSRGRYVMYGLGDIEIILNTTGVAALGCKCFSDPDFGYRLFAFKAVYYLDVVC